MSTNKPVKSNSRKAMKFRGPECLNCGHPLELSDRYCSYCSQLNTSKQLALKDFFNEFIGSVLTYDSRLRYTLKDVLFKPGTITRNYVRGQRLKYANPFRFFLSVSIIYFLLNGLIVTYTDTGNSLVQIDGEPITTSTNFSTENQQKVLDKLNKELDENNLDPVSLDSIFQESNIPIDPSEIVDAVTKDNDTVFKYISEEHLDTLNMAKSFLRRFTLYQDYFELKKIKNPSVALDSLKHNNTRFNRWMYEKNNSIERVKENPFGFANYMMEKIPFFLFFFAPVFAFFFWLIYSKKEYTYMEHLVLIFNIFSFIFLGLLICLIPDLLIGADVISGILITIIAPFYVYKTLRNFYKQSRLITIIKFVFLNFVFFISSTIGAIIFFAITAAAY